MTANEHTWANLLTDRDAVPQARPCRPVPSSNQTSLMQTLRLLLPWLLTLARSTTSSVQAPGSGSPNIFRCPHQTGVASGQTVYSHGGWHGCAAPEGPCGPNLKPTEEHRLPCSRLAARRELPIRPRTYARRRTNPATSIRRAQLSQRTARGAQSTSANYPSSHIQYTVSRSPADAD